MEIKISAEKAVHLLNCKALFVDPNGAYQRNMALRQLHNKLNKLEASEKTIKVDISRSDLTHFRNGIAGGILRQGTTDRDVGHLMACADSLRITTWVEGILPKMDEKEECSLPLDADEDDAMDPESPEGNGE